MEILKVLYQGAEVLIFDEPTSVLSPMEVELLFSTMKTLRGQGRAVVLITHKLKEALSITDRLTILKQGAKAGEMSGDELHDPDQSRVFDRILRTMFTEISPGPARTRRATIGGDPVFELHRLVTADAKGTTGLKNVSFRIRSGEILGLAGVDGNGQKALAEAIGGQGGVISGRILYHGRDITTWSVRRRFEHGIRVVPDDRLGEGLCAGHGSGGELDPESLLPTAVLAVPRSSIRPRSGLIPGS